MDPGYGDTWWRIDDVSNGDFITIAENDVRDLMERVGVGWLDDRVDVSTYRQLCEARGERMER